jgi:hypothetical protein
MITRWNTNATVAMKQPEALSMSNPWPSNEIIFIIGSLMVIVAIVGMLEKQIRKHWRHSSS